MLELREETPEMMAMNVRIVETSNMEFIYNIRFYTSRSRQFCNIIRLQM